MSAESLANDRRIGLIVPSSNSVVEVDFVRALPPGVSLHTARMFLVDATAQAEVEMVTRYLPRAAEDLASLYPHVVVFACTSAGAVLGADGEAQLIRHLGEVCRAPAVSTNDAVGTCIARLNPSRVAVVTPYVDELNRRIQESLERRGLNVTRIAGMGLAENVPIARVTPESILNFAEEQLDGASFDLLFVSCTNFRGVEARPKLQRRFGVPVVTSNQATIDATLEVLGLHAEATSPTTATAP